MATTRPGSSRSLLPATFSSGISDENSFLSFVSSSFFQLSLGRRCLLFFSFLLGFVLTAIMKREHLLWLLTTTVGAKPRLELCQGREMEFPGLRFGADGLFNITIFADLHFGEEAWGGDLVDNDAKTIKVMESVLDNESPNLVVLNGDLLTGEAVLAHNYTNHIDRIFQPLINRKLPWASTYGNHDRTKLSTPTTILQHEKEIGGNVQGHRLAWTSSMVGNDDLRFGTSNYYIPIYTFSGDCRPELAMVLWFFDSRAGAAFQKGEDGQTVPVEDWVAPEVARWFALEKAAFKQQFKRPIPSLAFVHIPVQATRALQEKGVNKATNPGLNQEIIGHQANTCDNQGNCEYNGNDSPFMKELLSTEGLKAVFSGHDHGIDWCMQWYNSSKVSNRHGIHLCFNRHTGYGGYGKDWKRGARQVVIREDLLEENELETWIRLEDGTISSHVDLNSTYGQDAYPDMVGETPILREKTSSEENMGTKSDSPSRPVG
ncbi:Metallo-dependent phosphatase-like protein [Dendryphion nanum]|uniref:Metallo-dependent phosphatase-like protein n=1 Tax=Dendryphion nanum TaxID=256645 RepID=A0A9P9D4J8_9PLEO|nr:Metallo-dependent phosphatase-like protein [Dendryphion nanum]